MDNCQSRDNIVGERNILASSLSWVVGLTGPSLGRFLTISVALLNWASDMVERRRVDLIDIRVRIRLGTAASHIENIIRILHAI